MDRLTNDANTSARARARGSATKRPAPVRKPRACAVTRGHRGFDVLSSVSDRAIDRLVYDRRCTAGGRCKPAVTGDERWLKSTPIDGPPARAYVVVGCDSCGRAFGRIRVR